MQYDTTINDWHTCPNTGRINASNPCSEYMHIDNSACNLASLNLMKYMTQDGKFDVELFKRDVDTMITSMDILVDNYSYPTPKITENAKNYRELGLGYANLGALLMALGFSYDSEKGRAVGGQITSLKATRKKFAELLCATWSCPQADGIGLGQSGLGACAFAARAAQARTRIA